MTPTELISQIKDYADIADASYAMLHYINENDEQGFLDSIKKPELKPELWKFADGINLGYEVTDENVNKSDLAKELLNDKKIKLGQPTAYACAIEARFSQDSTIIRPSKDNPNENDKEKFIGNKVQNFIYRYKDDTEAKEQKFLIALNYEQHNKDPKQFRFHLSPRTKHFVSRYKFITHQKNTSISGYSYTLFKDSTKNDNTYILAFRGTETQGMELSKDFLFTDAFILLVGLGIPQILSLLNYTDSIIKRLIQEQGDDNFSIDVVGHSLGGHLAQYFCAFCQKKYPKRLYTYNAPGIAGGLKKLKEKQ